MNIWGDFFSVEMSYASSPKACSNIAHGNWRLGRRFKGNRKALAQAKLHWLCSGFSVYLC